MIVCPAASWMSVRATRVGVVWPTRAGLSHNCKLAIIPNWPSSRPIWRPTKGRPNEIRGPSALPIFCSIVRMATTLIIISISSKDHLLGPPSFILARIVRNRIKLLGLGTLSSRKVSIVLILIIYLVKKLRFRLRKMLKVTNPQGQMHLLSPTSMSYVQWHQKTQEQSKNSNRK